MKVRELKEYLEPLDNELELTDLYLLNTVKTCKNCGYRAGDQCLLSGTFHSTERFFNTKCSAGYSAWVPKQPKLGLLTKIKNFLI
jgi:hypothetical protein